MVGFVEPGEKPQLYCNSNFLQYKTLDDPAPQDKTKTVRGLFSGYENYEATLAIAADVSIAEPTPLENINWDKVLMQDQSYLYYLPTQNAAKGGAWLFLSKDQYKMFPKDKDGNPSYCEQKKTYAWTIEAGAAEYGRVQPMVILCPASFDKMTSSSGRIPNTLDLKRQRIGRILDTMESRMVTWYHELFHLYNDPEGKQPGAAELSQPANILQMARSGPRTHNTCDLRSVGTVNRYQSKCRHKIDHGGGKRVCQRTDTAYYSWPAKKSGFVDSGKPTYGAVECMYLALYDVAEDDDTVDRSQEHQPEYGHATKNPETYAWFGVAAYLSVEGAAHQDWSTGAAREKGSLESRVTVTRKRPQIPRATAF